MILVRYDSETKIVNGYFIKGEKYFSNIVEDDNIDGFPFIEISEEEQKADRVMYVANNKYTETL